MRSIYFAHFKGEQNYFPPKIIWNKCQIFKKHPTMRRSCLLFGYFGLGDLEASLGL